MTASAEVTGTVLEDVAPELAKTYAEALLGAAGAVGQVDAVLDELDELIRDVIQRNPAFARLMQSPSLSPKEKDRVLTKLFEGRALPVVSRFLRVLNRRGRVGLLPSIVREAHLLWNHRQNRRPVSIRSAIPIAQAQQAALAAKLEAMTGSTPIMKVDVDPSLIGGLIVQIGDDVYDASIRTRLAQMRQSIVEGKIQELRGRGLIEV
jgi:F-type H+-transporting ATPase subunit delta